MRRQIKETDHSPTFDPERLNAAWKVIDTEIERGVIPGASAAVTLNGRRFFYTSGVRHKIGEANPLVRADTIYDCASLTKVVVTLPLALMLIDEGLIDLEHPVADIWPSFAAGGKGNITIRQLLTHTSGMPSYAVPAKLGKEKEGILAGICGLEKTYEPGTRTVYSCLGFITLGRIVEIVTGQRLEEAAARRIFQPLGMTSSGYMPAEGMLSRIAATELDPASGEFRRGFVHDELAAALGGVSGNAGLFATAEDLLSYGELWLCGGMSDNGRLLSQAAVSKAVRSHTLQIPNASRGLGWVLRGDSSDAGGDWLSDSSYGHTGFTGTSLWVDPERELVVVLLTNRVHFGRNQSIARLRIRLHNAIAAAVVE